MTNWSDYYKRLCQSTHWENQKSIWNHDFGWLPKLTTYNRIFYL